jgi:deoxyadenosine/deoxycytidine kinase
MIRTSACVLGVTMKIVYVEGSIGAGKSSLLRGLDAMGHCVVQEPVDDWAEHLKLVYRDSRWRLPMQCLALSTRVERLLKTLNGTAPVFVERSMRSAQIFANLDSTVDNPYQVIHDHYSRLVDELLARHTVQTIYLRASVDTCMERVSLRERGGEDAISRDLMEKLHEEHERAFFDASLIVDAEQDMASTFAKVCKGLLELDRVKGVCFT